MMKRNLMLILCAEFPSSICLEATRDLSKRQQAGAGGRYRSNSFSHPPVSGLAGNVPEENSNTNNNNQHNTERDKHLRSYMHTYSHSIFEDINVSNTTAESTFNMSSMSYSMLSPNKKSTGLAQDGRVFTFSGGGAFGCPILGEVIPRRFRVLCWSVGTTDSVHGISEFRLHPKVACHDNRDIALVSLTLKHVGMYDSSDEDLLYFRSQTAVYQDVTRDLGGINILVTSTKDAIARQLQGISSLGVFRAFSHTNSKTVMDQSSTNGGAQNKIENKIDNVQEVVTSNIENNNHNTLQTQTEKQSISKSLEQNEKQEENYEDIMSKLSEARDLLPQLLAMPSSIDTMLLSEQLLLPSVEKMTMLACDIVTNVIKYEVHSMLHRLRRLYTVRSTITESLEVVNSILKIKEKLIVNNEKISMAIGMCRSELLRVDKDDDEVWLRFRRSAEVRGYKILITLFSK